MEITYTHAHSFSVCRPPTEQGFYAVKYLDGTTSKAFWDGSQWTAELEVKRYCGRPTLLKRNERKQHFSNILAGEGLPSDSNGYLIARRSALVLARHNAMRMEQAGSDRTTLKRALTMCGHYMVARHLGVSFDLNDDDTLASAVDKKLLKWALGTVEGEKIERIKLMLQGKLANGPDFPAWLKDRLR